MKEIGARARFQTPNTAPAIEGLNPKNDSMQAWRRPGHEWGTRTETQGCILASKEKELRNNRPASLYRWGDQ